MSYNNKNRLGLTAILAMGAALAVPAHAQSVMPADTDLSAQALSDGQTIRAIATLEAELEASPGDPALLINLGIARAQIGETEKARANFEAAMRSRDVVDLETANGTMTDSRRLARKAMAMLERGEFRTQSASGSQFTLRD